MNPISLNKIPIKGLEIKECIDFDETYYKNTDIVELNQVSVVGSIKKDYNQDILLNLNVEGTMKIKDSRTLDPIDHAFAFQIEEKLDETNEEIQEYFEKKQNILDIMGILWENIVLEVPISKTSANLDTQEGEGWELVSNKKESIDPRLSPLEGLLDKEKE